MSIPTTSSAPSSATAPFNHPSQAMLDRLGQLSAAFMDEPRRLRPAL